MMEYVPLDKTNYKLLANVGEELEPDDDAGAFTVRLPFDLFQGSLLVAQVHAVLLRVEAAEREGFSAIEVFDLNPELRNFHVAAYDVATGTLREGIAAASGLRDVLYIDSVKVIPARRGRKLALRIVERIRELFSGGCSLVALDARPLSLHDSKYPDEVDDDVFAAAFPSTGAAASAKLRAYWSELGFQPVGDRSTDFLTVNPRVRLPRVTV